MAASSNIRSIIKAVFEFLGQKPCQAFSAPFDLRLPEANQTDEESTFVVQPDIVIICDNKELKGTGYSGTPTLIIEISSASTARSDKVWKFNRYGRPQTYTEDDTIQTPIFPDLTINLNTVFPLT